MSLLLDCRKFCNAHELLSCQAVIIGVSGGADSMCLLDILFSLSEESKKEAVSPPFPEVIAAHVNHGLRGDDADQDEELVRNYCKDRGILFRSQRVDITSLAARDKISLEDAGRRVRYAFFEEIAAGVREEFAACIRKDVAAGVWSEYSKIFIAVAHHREDQAETLLMNLFRGAGPDGLCGMQPINENVIRPLLFASKEDILAYVHGKPVPFSEDLTNQDNIYTRNCWRNQILPLIAEASRKDPVGPLLAFSDIVNTDKEYFEEITADIFEKNKNLSGSGTFGLPIDVLRLEHRAVASRLVRYLYKAQFACATDLTSAHVTAILSLSLSGKNGGMISLPHSRIAYLSEDVLFFEEISELGRSDSSFWNTDDGQILLCPTEMIDKTLVFFDSFTRKEIASISKTSFALEVILVENPEQVVYNGQIWYCPRQILKGAVLRTRRTSDWFSRAGSSGGKPLRRFLTDRKIPVFVRDRMILAAHDSEILWIPGVSHAAGFVDEASGRKYFESIGLTMNEMSIQSAELYRITIINNNEQEER